MTHEEKYRAERRPTSYAPRKWIIGRLWVLVQIADDYWARYEEDHVERTLFGASLLIQGNTRILKLTFHRLSVGFTILR